MKIYIFILFFFVFLGGIIAICGNKPVPFFVYESFYEEANKTPKEYRIATKKDVEKLKQKDKEDRKNRAPYYSEIEADRYDYCIIDNFGKGYKMPNDKYRCDYKYLKEWVKKENKTEKEFFEKNGITIDQAYWKYMSEKEKEEYTNREIKKVSTFSSICILSLLFCLGIEYIYVRFSKNIRLFFIKIYKKITMKTYLIILATLITISIICIALKVCL